MNLLECPDCGLTSAFPGAAHLLAATILHCPFCGYKDYGYIWNRTDNQSRHCTISADSIKELLGILNAIPDGSDATAVLATFAKKYCLSINTMINLIRTIESMMRNNDHGFVWNSHRFIHIKEEEISVAELRRLIVDQINNHTDRPVTPIIEINPSEMPEWEEKYESLQREFNSLKQNYTELIHKYKQIEEELLRYKSFLD